MKTRAITGLVMAVVFIPLIIIPELLIPFQILMIAGVVIAALELLKMFDKDKIMGKDIKAITVGLTLVVYLGTAWFSAKTVVSLNGHLGTKFMLGSFIAIMGSLALMIWENDFTGSDVGKVLTTVFYVGVGFGSLVLLRLLGLRFISYLFLITVCTDVFAYLFGVKFGKTKMAPNISPKKSWEGAITGTIVATIIAGLFGLFYGKIFTGGMFNPNGAYDTILTGTTLSNTNFEGVLIFVLTILLSVVGQIGDLVASKFKRTYDVKDFGNVFPGHGGVMDRFDSAIFAATFFVLILLLLAF